MELLRSGNVLEDQFALFPTTTFPVKNLHVFKDGLFLGQRVNRHLCIIPFYTVHIFYILQVAFLLTISCPSITILLKARSETVESFCFSKMLNKISAAFFACSYGNCSTDANGGFSR